MRRRMLFEQEVPYIYQRVSYIENTGNSFIAGGNLPNGNSLKFEVKHYRPSQATGENALVYIKKQDAGLLEFAFTNSKNNAYLLYCSAKYLNLSSGKSASTATSGVVGQVNIAHCGYGQDAQVIIGASTARIAARIYHNGSSSSFSACSNTNGTTQPFGGETVGMFANPFTGGVAATGRIYYLKVYVDGVLVQNYIPVYRISDGEIGMWESIGKTFYTNGGSGTFSKGADV